MFESRFSRLVHQSLSAALLTFTVISLVFFALYSFHAQSPEQLISKQVLDTGSPQFPFPADQADHMWDVFRLLQVARVMAALALLGILVLALRMDLNAFRAAGTHLMILPVVLAAIPWEYLFEVFHLILFPQGNWQFPPGSAILRAYPAEFFASFAIVWAFICLLAGLMIVIGSTKVFSSWEKKVVPRKSKKKKAVSHKRSSTKKN